MADDAIYLAALAMGGRVGRRVRRVTVPDIADKPSQEIVKRVTEPDREPWQEPGATRLDADGQAIPE